MVDFALLPPEINSARMFAGVGSGPLLAAASEWELLAADLQGSATSFESVISTTLATRSWSGPAALAMVAVATPYAQWLISTALLAEDTATQLRLTAATFEAAHTATVPLLVVEANRMLFNSLVATNILGQNTSAIASTEYHYGEMWAQDVAAMFAYQYGVKTAVGSMTPFSPPPNTQPGDPGLVTGAGGGSGAGSGGGSAASSLLSSAPMLLSSLGEAALTPATMLISPLMSMGQSAPVGAAGVVGAGGAVAGSVPKLAGVSGGLGSGVSAMLGQARSVQALSVPPAWAGALPVQVGGSAMSAVSGTGLSAAVSPTAAGVSGMGGAGMPMMPMAGMGGGGGELPAGTAGRGWTLDQARPTVVPRIGVG